MFNAASQGHLFAGQWVYTGARDWVKADYDTTVELAVVYRIYGDGKLCVFYTLDGKKAVVPIEGTMALITKLQETYNSQPQFGFSQDRRERERIPRRAGRPGLRIRGDVHREISG